MIRKGTTPLRIHCQQVFPGATSGNQNLQPETGETVTYGIVLAPRFLDGLVISLDYLEIDISDAILSVSSQNIVNKCYDSPTLANDFCALISRNDDPASAQSGGLDFLRQVQLNFGAAIFEGYDATASYDFMAFDTAMRASMTWSTVDKLLDIEQGGSEDDELERCADQKTLQPSHYPDLEAILAWNTLVYI